LSATLEDPNTSELKLARRWTTNTFVDDDETASLVGKAESREAPREPLRLADPVPGATLASRYLLKSVIGRGGDAIVFRAQDRRQPASGGDGPGEIAIKILRAQKRANPEAIARLKREFEHMRSLSHPGIARVFELVRDGDTEVMSMELVAGRKLSDWLREPHGSSERLEVIKSCAEALAYMHGRGVLHGDLKLANVLVRPDGITLIDFGTARRIADSQPDGLPAVTASYASPQVLEGGVAEVRDEIFSLACLSYVVLSRGVRPFGEMSPLEASRVGAVPAAIPDVPAPVLGVLLRSLSFDRAARPASFEEFLVAWSMPREEQREIEVAPDSVNLLLLAPEPVTEPAAVPAPTHAPRSPLVPEPMPAPEVVARHERPRLRRSGRAPIILSAVAAVAALSVLAFWPEHGSRESPPLAPAEARPVVAKAEPAPVSPVAAPESQPAPPVSPRVRGQITFDTPVVRVPAAQTLVAIPVRRTNSTRGVGLVAWSIEPFNARPGVDYQPVVNQVIRFNDGQAARSLFIELGSPDSRATSREPRSFVVKLSQVPGGAALGSVTHTTVTLDPG
jgi:serine/threonine protein kinase